ncbi:polysaccharide deacetylase family protein [Piscinibacter koreensis]|uniref:Polysaccharide deacetylase family protein n=1 Tax=Piscinibacter koreensis TaxID=2742824 RepID=A0A7Y6TYG0_9BURK|nr:polysaccharide deacetylase family protein [Schlegelella koreensis]NUZ08164.1 polysaccharide deacetylase family protein [Schlegelella koreensis]
MPRGADARGLAPGRRARGGAGAAARRAALAIALAAAPAFGADCGTCRGAAGERPLYLTFDTGHMGVAPLVAEVLARQGVKATFFVANEPTLDGGSSLDERWAPWWKARVAEGHAFGSHTFDHVYWVADRGAAGFRMKPAFGADAGHASDWSAARYCAELNRSAERFRAITGEALLPIFRAPGGKTSPALLAAARGCGWLHVGWSPAGFLGDELPSERASNRQLLERALRDVRPGDILLAHLGIWSRKDAWAPAVLEPLIAKLRSTGFCFATLREHPAYRSHLQGK